MGFKSDGAQFSEGMLLDSKLREMLYGVWCTDWVQVVQML